MKLFAFVGSTFETVNTVIVEVGNLSTAITRGCGEFAVAFENVGKMANTLSQTELNNLLAEQEQALAILDSQTRKVQADNA